LNSWWWAWWCPKHVEQAIRSAIKTSVASSWHFISTYLVPLVEQDVWTPGPVWTGVENMMGLFYLLYWNESSVNRYEIAGFDTGQQGSSCDDIRFHRQCIGQQISSYYKQQCGITNLMLSCLWLTALLQPDLNSLK